MNQVGSVTLIFRWDNRFYEDSFALTQTVGVVKAVISHQLPGTSASQLHLDFAGNKEPVFDDQRLSEIFPNKGSIINVVDVIILPPPTAPVAGTKIPRSVSPEPDIPAVVTVDSEDPLYMAVSTAIALPTDRIIDELQRILSGQVGREVLISIYSAAVEACSTVEDQTRFLVNTIVEFEFDVYLLVDDTFKCPVCSDDFQGSRVFEFMCGLDQEDQEGEPHALCYTCAREYVNTFASNGDPNVKCYTCDHNLSVNEIALILGNGSISQGQQDPLFEMIDVLKRDFVVGRDPSKYATCPVGGCNYFVERSEVGAIEEATCPECEFTFCTNCVRAYHYRRHVNFKTSGGHGQSLVVPGTGRKMMKCAAWQSKWQRMNAAGWKPHDETRV